MRESVWLRVGGARRLSLGLWGRGPALVAMVAGLGLPGQSLAAVTFDGAWSVQIVTERGECDKVYRYPIAIQDNQIRLRSIYGETSNHVAGRIGDNGRVQGTIGHGTEQVSVTGRLKGASGAGRWDAPSRGCAGRWSAEKRG